MGLGGDIVIAAAHNESKKECVNGCWFNLAKNLKWMDTAKWGNINNGQAAGRIPAWIYMGRGGRGGRGAFLSVSCEYQRGGFRRRERAEFVLFGLVFDHIFYYKKKNKNKTG
eukprot:TRINITY_DN18936_c0_g1_i2.p2 TRINITY_DN18936_c0_g1~~TRINITY_DN18936_c0_g1_i2.p2  ORF type:complete len:112 (-),score=1.28 TRINITY_DN18936_c0_g1_i2:384-719(-)